MTNNLTFEVNQAHCTLSILSNKSNIGSRDLILHPSINQYILSFREPSPLCLSHTVSSRCLQAWLTSMIIVAQPRTLWHWNWKSQWNCSLWRAGILYNKKTHWGSHPTCTDMLMVVNHVKDSNQSPRNCLVHSIHSQYQNNNEQTSAMIWSQAFCCVLFKGFDSNLTVIDLLSATVPYQASENAYSHYWHGQMATRVLILWNISPLV